MADGAEPAVAQAHPLDGFESVGVGVGDVREVGAQQYAVAEGLRWTIHNPAVRTLSLTILIFNVTFGAAEAYVASGNKPMPSARDGNCHTNPAVSAR